MNKYIKNDITYFDHPLKYFHYANSLQRNRRCGKSSNKS